MHLVFVVVEHRVEVLEEGQAESERVSVPNALNSQLALAVEVEHEATRLDNDLATARLDCQWLEVFACLVAVCFKADAYDCQYSVPADCILLELILVTISILN